MESSNIYIVIIVIAILFLLLDYVITNIHFKLETFHNPEGMVPSDKIYIDNKIEITFTVIILLLLFFRFII